jgi:hypothetical protein
MTNWILLFLFAAIIGRCWEDCALITFTLVVLCLATYIMICDLIAKRLNQLTRIDGDQIQWWHVSIASIFVVGFMSFGMSI